MYKGTKEWPIWDWDSPGLQITPEVTEGSGPERRGFASDSSQTFIAQWTTKLLARQRSGITKGHPLVKLQLAFCILSMTTIASAATCTTPECAPPEGWDNFANNLGSDLAPLLALFGEQVTKQYMSESLSWMDSLLFSLAPLGIITAIVGAIRVAGKPTFRSLIGRARESRGEVEADLMSSTSPDVCELWNGEGVVRVLGSPVLLQLIHGEEMEDFGPDSDKNAGIYTFREAIRRGFYKKQGAKANAITDLSQTLDMEMRDYSDIEHLLTRENPPNLSLNVSMHPLNRWVLIGLVIFGFLLQGGVLVFAAIAQYKLELQKNGLPVVSYGFPVFLVGTLLLALGMFLCAHTVETSTDEVTWVPDKGPRSVIWLQQGGQTVGDQRFESFARITEWSTNKHSENSILTSSQPVSNLKTGRSFLVTMAVSITFVGFVIQFVGLRVMHSLVTVTQLGAVLIMTTLRSCAHIQRNAKNDINDPSQAEGHEQDQVEHHAAEQVGGHELDWLAKKLGEIQTWEIVAEPESDEGLESISSRGVASPDVFNPAMRVLKIRARLAQLSSDWKLKDRSMVKVLRNAIETTTQHVFNNMTLNDGLQREKEFSWSVPVKTKDRGLSIESSKINLVLTRDMYENGNWSDWMADETMIEAVLCLSISSLTETDRKRARASLTRLMPVRLLGPATLEARADYRMWTHRGTALTETTLEPDNARYFGWISGIDVIPANTESTRYLCANAKDELDLLCAQQIYAEFLFHLLSGVKELGGSTVLRSDDAQASNDCGHVQLNNSNLVPIAISYHESGLGTIEEAYFSIIPALRASGKLPSFSNMELAHHPQNVYHAARKEAIKLTNDEIWDKAAEIESWLCQNSDKSDLARHEFIITDEQIGRRILKMTKKLVAEAKKGGANDNLRKLWDTAYLQFKIGMGTVEDRAWSLLNLSMSCEMIKPATDLHAVFELAFHTIAALDMKKYHLTKIGAKFVQFATDNAFFDEAEEISRCILAGAITWGEERQNDNRLLIKQLIDIRQSSGQFLVNNNLNLHLPLPDRLQFAVNRDVNCRVNGFDIADKSMPIDLLLISGYRTLLQVAAEYGHKSIVLNLLNSKVPHSVNSKPANYAGRTALQAAAGSGRIKVVNLLISSEADVNAKPSHNNGRTALQAAADGGCVDIVRILLTAKADVNAEPSHYNGRTALQAAAGGGHLELVEIFLAANSSVNAKPSIHDGRTALQAAAEGGHVQVVEILLAARADVNAGPSEYGGRTALQAAAGGGQVEAVKILLAAGASVNAGPSDSRGRTALQAAAGGGHVEVVEILLAARASVSAEPSFHNGRTALQAAVDSGSLEVLKMLLGTKVGANTETSSARLLLAATRSGNTGAVKLLLDAKVDVNKVRGILYKAAISGHDTVVELLIAAKADINEGEIYSSTPLFGAALNGHVAVVRLLLAAGANANISHRGKSVIDAATKGGHQEVVQILQAAVGVPTA